MKRKIWATIASAAAVLALVGCSSKEKDGPNPVTDIVDVVDTNLDVDGGVTGSNPVSPDEVLDTPDTENSIATVISYDGAYAIFNENYDTIYIIDSYDRMITSYDRSKLADISSVQDANFEDASFVGYSDGIVYFISDSMADDEVYSSIYAVDVETNEAIVVCHYSQNETVSAVDIYDGKMYVTFSSVVGSEKKFYEDVYTKLEDSFEYEVSEGEQNTFLGKIKVDSIYTNSINSANHVYCNASVERSVAEYGLVIAEASGEYEIVNSGGSIQAFEVPYSSVSICGYDTRYVALTGYNDEYYGRYIYCYDMLDNAYRTVGEADAVFLGFVDGYLYYAQEEGEDYGWRNFHTYKYEPSSGTTQELYDLYNAPGAKEVDAGVTGFCYIKDHPLFLQCQNGKIGWMAVYYDEAGATYKNLDCSVAEIDWWKYGTVSCYSTSIDCPFCVNRLVNYYSETYKVAESVADGYEVINAHLQEIEDGYYEKYIGELYEVEDSSQCDIHVAKAIEDYIEIYVTDVCVLSDAYIAVKYEFFSYSGGSHGSYSSKQYLFDLVTGELVTIEDLYEGTEEEFREFIAQKTMDDYSVNYTKYYDSYSGGQGLYDNAYAAAGYNDVELEFYADKVVLVYQEYEMGPYAAGQIRIDMTYQELFGRDSL